MEEDAAAALYDEIQAKGAGAARFKQGLGFAPAPVVQPRPAAPPSRPTTRPARVRGGTSHECEFEYSMHDKSFCETTCFWTVMMSLGYLSRACR